MMLALIVTGIALAFYGTLIIATHKSKVEVLEINKDDEVPKEL